MAQCRAAEGPRPKNKGEEERRAATCTLSPCRLGIAFCRPSLDANLDLQTPAEQSSAKRFSRPSSFLLLVATPTTDNCLPRLATVSTLQQLLGSRESILVLLALDCAAHSSWPIGHGDRHDHMTSRIIACKICNAMRCDMGAPGTGELSSLRSPWHGMAMAGSRAPAPR